MEAAFRPPTPQSTTSSVTPPLLQSQFLPDQTSLQRRFQTLLEGAEERWMYAIYWECSHNHSSAASILSWGYGYYNGNGEAEKAMSFAEQAHRKNILRTLNSIIFGPSSTEDDCNEDITDPEWFFSLSMLHNFVNGTGGLLGQAFFNSSPVWVTGSDRLSELACQRARRLPEIGLQTMVCIPCQNGVVELVSTEVVLPNQDLIIKVRDLFNFNHPVADLPSSEIMQPREDKMLHERESVEMQNDEREKLSKQCRGKEKMSDSKCSWLLLSESSEGGSDTTYSHSYDYSGPS